MPSPALTSGKAIASNSTLSPIFHFTTVTGYQQIVSQLATHQEFAKEPNNNAANPVA
jgi:hypothetical protein